jgi:nitrogen fixation/metabolism regulation signal transduction histidine kinase
VFALDQLGRSTDLWVRPGVSRALDSGVEVSKSALARLDAIAITQADAWAEDWLASGPNGPPRAECRARLQRAGLDFLQIYRREGRRWKLVEQIAPTGLFDVNRTDFSGSIPDSLPVPAVIHGPVGSLAAAADAGRGTVVATGWWMSQDFFEGIDRVTEGAGHYRQLGLLVALQRNYTWILVAGLVVALLLSALLVSAALAREMSRPLAELATALGRIAKDDLEVRVTPSGARELRGLGLGFNTMAERLSRARESLRRAEREAAWRQVARYLAHEINNMLSPIGSAAYRIEKRLPEFPSDQQPAVRDSLVTVRQSLDDLGRLAEQFPQYARLPEPRLETLDLAEVIGAAVQLERDLEIRVIEPDERLAIRADRMLISRALHNLLVNAREAGPEPGAIEVRTERRDGRAVVEVLDRGSGLDAEASARLFEPFVSTKKRGSGLGLSLVRDIMTQHGGEVALENREGGGARARLLFPLASSGPEGSA